MSVINGDSPERNKRRRKSTTSRITAPNGSVISNSSSNKISAKNPYNISDSGGSKKAGSIISQSYSERPPVKSGKAGSVVSGVSSQVARRKRLEAKNSNIYSLPSRSMSASSLGCRSNGSLFGDLTRDKCQSDVSLALTEEIQMLSSEERALILGAIRKCKQNEKQENRRKQMLTTKINEIKAMRPPFPVSDPKICYICFKRFWPIISSSVRCIRCNIMVCKKCLSNRKIGTTCSQCTLEMIYTAQLGSVFDRPMFYENEAEDSYDMLTIERLIVKSDVSRKSIMSRHPIDQYDTISTKSKTVSSIADKLSLQSLLKKKKKSSLISISRHSVEEDTTVEYDSKGLVEKAMSNSRIETCGDASYPSVHGEIMLGLSYNNNKKELTVIIKKCRDLPAAIVKQSTSNPFVKVGLLPEVEGETAHTTKIKHSNLNPVFNEEFKFRNITFDQMVARTLYIIVFHNEVIGVNLFLGQKSIPLTSHSFENATGLWYTLEDKKQETIHPTLSKYHGDINFSLKYCNSDPDNYDNAASQVYANSLSLPSGCIKLFIKQGTNLLAAKYSKLLNSYVKCVLLPEITKETKRKTHVMRRSINPMWNIQFTFAHISHQELKDFGLEISVWDKKIGFIPDVLLGGVSMNLCRVNKSVNKTENDVWDMMIEKPDTWIEATLLLRTDIR